MTFFLLEDVKYNLLLESIDFHASVDFIENGFDDDYQMLSMAEWIYTGYEKINTAKLIAL